MNKVKFQFEMPQTNADRLDDLAKQAGVAKKDIINNALTLLEWAITEVQDGRIIVSLDPKEDKYRELVLPLLRDFSEVTKSKLTPV